LGMRLASADASTFKLDLKNCGDATGSETRVVAEIAVDLHDQMKALSMGHKDVTILLWRKVRNDLDHRFRGNGFAKSLRFFAHKITELRVPKTTDAGDRFLARFGMKFKTQAVGTGR
jgi:hypothetical protein